MRLEDGIFEVRSPRKLTFDERKQVLRYLVAETTPFLVIDVVLRASSKKSLLDEIDVPSERSVSVGESAA